MKKKRTLVSRAMSKIRRDAWSKVPADERSKVGLRLAEARHGKKKKKK